VSPSQSLRTRVVVGSLLWTMGLIAIAIVTGAVIAHRKPAWIPALHLSLIATVSVILVVAGLGQIRRGLAPFSTLRSKLAAVRDGRDRRVDGRYPEEVQPLVDELNALLEERERRVARAVAKAGDLAHGLKTPLAVMTLEASRAEAAGHHEFAAAIDQQIGRMRRQIEYHLAQTRAAASGAAAARSSVAASAEGLTRTLQRLHAERGLSIDLQIAPEHVVRTAREDLDEMLGNLLDNACQWASGRIVVHSSATTNGLVIAVDDDGPGLAESMRKVVLERGVRADEAAPGSGLGLAIVLELAVLYGGSITLETSPLGGLSARLRLPQA
jgi:signal transduction histidine kinase